MKKSFSNKVLFYTIIFLLLLNIPSLAISNSLIIKEKNDVFSYGFLIPLPTQEMISDSPELQYNTMNYINDLLSLNVPVYILSEEIKFFYNRIGDDLTSEKIFTTGTFIVPFTTDNSLNSEIIIITNDYNTSHELSKSNEKKLEIFVLMQSINNIVVNILHEPKIAYNYGEGIGSRGLAWYTESLRKAGFLNAKVLNDDDIQRDLTFNDFNVFIWPGGNIIKGMKSNLTLSERIIKQIKIKDFITSGGGFVGSCYGAFAASSGMRFLPFFLIQYYFPKLPTLGFLSISDSLLAMGLPSEINVSIQENDNPVTYGLHGTLNGSVILGGPVFSWIGGNTESLATVESIDLSWFKWLKSMDYKILEKIIDYWTKFTTGKTIWTSSEYEKGKIVTFGDHPESGDIKLKRAIHNSILYVSSNISMKVNITENYQLNKIIDIIIKTSNLTINHTEPSIFIDLYNKSDINIDLISKINSKYHDLTNLLENKSTEGYIDENFYYQIRSEGLLRFNDFISRYIQYFNGTKNEQGISYLLKNIESINYMLSQENITINYDINNLKENISNNFDKINKESIKLLNNFNKITKEINNYNNTNEQNEYILSLSKNIKTNSKTIEKYTPSIYYEVLRFSRNTWYYYENIITQS